jgi:hypothetical protein
VAWENAAGAPKVLYHTGAWPAEQRDAVVSGLNTRSIPWLLNDDELAVPKQHEPAVDAIIGAVTGRQPSYGLPTTPSPTVRTAVRGRRSPSSAWLVIGVVAIGLVVYRHTDAVSTRCALQDAATAFGAGDSISFWDKALCAVP